MYRIPQTRFPLDVNTRNSAQKCAPITHFCFMLVHTIFPEFIWCRNCNRKRGGFQAGVIRGIRREVWCYSLAVSTGAIDGIGEFI